MPERFSPEIEILFENWIRGKQLEVALFDLDDTLIDTNTLFGDQVAAFFEFCQQCAPQIDIEAFKAEFRRIDTESFQLLGVSPKKWDYVVNQLAETYGVEELKSGLSILHSIYSQSPVAFNGIEDTLGIFRGSGLRLGLVTHASQSWTDIKLDTLGFRDYFEHIKVIDVEQHKYKGAEHWREAVEQFDVHPSHVMAVGDNLRGDIESAHNVGISTLAWIPSRWHVYNQGSLPEGAVKVDKIENLIPTLIAQSTTL